MARHSCVNRKFTFYQDELKKKREPIVEQCKGEKKSCDHIDSSNLCTSYISPKTRWRLGTCPLATHVEIESKDTGKTRMGQQKQKKFKRR